MPGNNVNENIIEETTESTLETEGYTFEDLSDYSFEFSSGAGGWSTNFTIERDGYFTGNYHDSEMGETGEDYEDGTMYVSAFSGHFTNLVQVDEYTYEMTLSDISYANEVGSEEIWDNVRYCYSEAYGFENATTFLVYAPGTPVNVFDEDVWFWIQWSVGEDSVLKSPVIVNKDQDEGMYSYDRLSAAEDAEISYKNYRESYDYWCGKNVDADTTMDMYIYTEKSYEVADECLNYLWNLIKYNTDEETFSNILEEQRAWLKERDEQAEQNRDSWEGGSFAKVDYLDTMGTMTMERCEKLLEYIEQECK